MIEIRLKTDPQGLVYSVFSLGHAKKSGEYSLACALVTEILQSLALWLSKIEGLRLEGSAPQKGALSMVVDYGNVADERLLAVSLFVVHQLKTAREHFKTEIDLDIEIIEGR